jgi:C_GCAxxG_C_C family probable redox protein
VSEEQKAALIAEAEERARNYFKQGLNCTECLLQTIMDLNNVNLPQEVICLATGFGGGIGETKHICGAITGAVMALGAVRGRRDPFAKETLKERIVEIQSHYDPFAEMATEINDIYGTLICKELTTPLGDYEGKARKKNCMQIIGHCAAITQKYAMRP